MIAEFAAWVVVLLVAVPVLTFAVECIAGAAPGRDRVANAPTPPFAVIMPAHNEAAGIAAAVSGALAQMRSVDRLLVVADNCTDDTAVIARALGAEVIRRQSTTEIGKGFALAAGRAALAHAGLRVVVVLDADCHAEAGALQLLAAEAARTRAAVQGCYLLINDDRHSAARLSAFAFVVKNLVRQRGLQRLGAPAVLQGSGMAFPWPLFDAARLASPSLAEDLELGLDLLLAGHEVRFLASARFTSAASTREATIGQRTRWEHGSVATGWRYGPALVKAGLRGRLRLVGLALDLIVPPLALLALLQVVAVMLTGGLALFGGSPAPLIVALGIVVVFAASVGWAWHRAGREYLSFATLMRVPGYVLWKLPIYARLLVDRQRAWIRTSRDA